ncbi:hypothetical protein [Pseudomonas shirazensis]
MKTEFIIKKFEKTLPNNFSVKLIEDIYIKGFLENEKIIKGIFLGSINDLSTTNIVASINFKEIENIISSNEDKFSITTINININKHLFNHKMEEDILSQLPISLDTEASVDRACEFVKQYIKQEAIPFFNYWQDIRNFLPFLETKDNGFIADLFSKDGFYKKVIIWKLCSHPGYEKLIDEMLDIFAEELKESPKDKFLKKDYDKYIKILKILEKTKPLYSWDDSYLIQKQYIR